MPSRKETTADREKRALHVEVRRTLVAQLISEGIYQPKLIRAELERRKMPVSRLTLWRDMQALDLEQERDFREHRKRFRRVVFNRYLRRERDAEKSIADIRADEDENYRRLTQYRELRKAAEEAGTALPEAPRLVEIDYNAKGRLLTVSMNALEKASAVAGIATQVIGTDAGDLASWAALARDGGAEAFAKRRARAFPEYEQARRKQRGARGAGSHA